ncbi:MAG: tetratricopeptide repeat protein [Lachnospiraceae bacterium]|nr:tetratricopeptide repeat protein [Lachnospiraceae bacterium]
MLLKKQQRQTNCKQNKKIGKKQAICVMAAAVLLGLTGCGKENTQVNMGMDQVAALDYSTAITTFESAIEQGEDKELAYRGEGMAYMGLMDYENAVAAFENALSNAGMFPSDVETDINYYLATAQYKAGMKEEAVSTLDAIADLKQKRPDVYFLRGSIKMEMDDVTHATEDLNLALYYADHDTDMIIRIYQVMERCGHKDEGRAYLTSAIEDRLSDMSDYEKGIIYFYLEDYENARDNLEAFRGSGKGDADALLMLGRTYEQLGDSNYAAGLYQKYLAENDPEARIWNQLGLCKCRTGEYADALTAFNSGLAMEGNASVLQELKFNQIVAYEYMGDFAKAAQLCRDYIQQYPDHEQAQREYTFLQTR